MKENPWRIELREEPVHKLVGGKWYITQNHYQITYNGSLYGSISKEAWDNKKTGDILEVVEQMLNDVHNIAIKEKHNEQCNLHERVACQKDSETDRAF